MAWNTPLASGFRMFLCIIAWVSLISWFINFQSILSLRYRVLNITIIRHSYTTNHYLANYGHCKKKLDELTTFIQKALIIQLIEFCKMMTWSRLCVNAIDSSINPKAPYRRRLPTRLISQTPHQNELGKRVLHRSIAKYWKGHTITSIFPKFRHRGNASAQASREHYHALHNQNGHLYFRLPRKFYSKSSAVVPLVGYIFQQRDTYAG